MKRKLKGSVNFLMLDGNIVEMKRENGRLIFYIEFCNITDVEEGNATAQINKIPWTCAGVRADKIEKLCKNGDLVRIQGFVAVSENKGNIKFKVQHLILLDEITKEIK